MKYSSEDIYDRSCVNRVVLAEIINLFVIKEKRARLLEFIASPKRYSGFLDELLNDPRNLKPECIIELPGDEQSVEIISKKLRNLGAGDKAYLVSNNDEFDGKIGKLEELLSLAAGEGLVYCLGARLGYYEGHENWRYILRLNQ
jgi:hypothetical protein